MSHKPVVSVVMIFWNAERFIREAIDSVFAQSFVDWELLLVDDGSTDASTAIAIRCSKEHPDRVRYLEHAGHENRGMSASRNLGIRNARGEFVSFLDSDDVWKPGKLAHQVGILESQREAAMVYGPTQYWYGWTGKRRDVRRDSVGELGVTPETLVQPPELLAAYLDSQGAVLPGICSLVARKNAIEAVGGFEDVFRGTYEDQVFLAKMCFSYPVFVTGECSDRYRQHPNSECAVAAETGDYHPSRPNAARGRFLRWLGDYLSEQRCEHPGVLRAYKKEVRPYRSIVGVLSLRRWTGKAKVIIAWVGKHTMPRVVRQWIKHMLWSDRYPPPVGWVRFGSLRRLAPISRDFGYSRGLPVDRYYIENFLESRAADIKGRTLEVGEATYTRRFGAGNVTQSDVLHVDAGAPGATIIADLVQAEAIASNAFDCFICTQTLQLIHEIQAAIDTIYRILKPGGVLLATFPGVSQISSDEWSETWSWGFTTISATRLFENAFPKENLTIEAHGNVLAATAFLHGLAAEELRRKELDYQDPEYELLITVRAVKPNNA